MTVSSLVPSQYAGLHHMTKLRSYCFLSASALRDKPLLFFSSPVPSQRRSQCSASQLKLWHSLLPAKTYFKENACQNNHLTQTLFFYTSFIQPLVTAVRLQMPPLYICIPLMATASVTTTAPHFHSPKPYELHCTSSNFSPS